MSGYDRQAALAALRGHQNKQAGEYLEKLITCACEHYERLAIAKIEKTPEPFRIECSLGRGKFSGHFTEQAQPDFKGVLADGKCIVFDAKHTDTGKIELSRLSERQNETLSAYQKLNACAGVLCSFGFTRFFWLPYTVFVNAKEENGHKYWNVQDAAPYEIFRFCGYIDFLQAGGKNVQ